MKDFDDVISKKMQELNKFSKKMASHKVDIEKLLKDQTIKDESIKFMNAKVTKKNEEIKKLNQNLESLDKILENKTLDLNRKIRNIKNINQ